MKFLRNKNYEKYIVLLFFVLWFLIFLGISCFRDSKADENIYIGDSVVISNLLKSGKWFGNYGVGLHGFVTKFLLGILFIFTGPSVFVATLFNIVLGISSGIVFFNILKKHFRLNLLYSLLGISLLFCSFQFATYIPTFYRDIGVLFFLLLVVENVLSKRNDWITGIFLMLVFDGKEHVFFTLAPAILLWIIVSTYIRFKDKNILIMLRESILKSIKIFLPSLVYLLLMFCTSLIPLNIYNANILGISDEGTKQLSINFSPEFATVNKDSETNPGVAKSMPLLQISEEDNAVLKIVKSVINIILSYVGKISYPRTFSFISIPFLILIPSIFLTFNKFKLWWQKKEYEKLFLPLVIYMYLLIYVLHASTSRYLLPISPLIIIFFLLALDRISLKEFKFTYLFILTTAFVSLGLVFEYSYIWVKVIFSVIILLLLLILRKTKDKTNKIVKYGIVILLSIFTFGTSLLASYRGGQIGGSLQYGYNRECEKIIGMVDKDDVLWINDIGWDRLPYVLRSENTQDPEWRWALEDWVPKKKLLRRETNFKTYSFNWKSEEEFQRLIRKKGINKIIYIQLEKSFNNEIFTMQNKNGELAKYDWLELEDMNYMRNKIVYVYNIVN